MFVYFHACLRWLLLLLLCVYYLFIYFILFYFILFIGGLFLYYNHLFSFTSFLCLDFIIIIIILRLTRITVAVLVTSSYTVDPVYFYVLQDAWSGYRL